MRRYWKRSRPRRQPIGSAAKEQTRNSDSFARLLAVSGALAVWLAIGGVICGLGLGLLEVRSHRYFEFEMNYLALTTLRDRIFSVLGAGAILFLVGGVLLGVAKTLAPLRPRGVVSGAFLLVVLLVYLLAGQHDRFRAMWDPLPAALRILAILGVVVLAGHILFARRIRRRTGGIPLAVAAIALLVPVGLAAASAATWAARAEDVRGRPNILFIVVDALRADHTGIHSYVKDPPITPRLDALAGEGYVFMNTVSNSIATRYTVPSIFTMVFPSVHGIVIDGQKLHPRFVTLAEHLREAGYATAAWTPNPSLKSVFGFDQGFAHYDDQILNDDPDLEVWEQFETAERINRRTLDWASGVGERPWFAYLHYRDPHFPYAPPPEYDGMYYEPKPDGSPHRPLTPEEIERQPAPGKMVPGDDRNDLAYYVAQYDAQIRYNDEKLGELLDALDARGVLENTVVIVTSDHGEGFLEHGRWNHGNLLYQEFCHVPGVVRLPRRREGPIRIEAPIHTFDLSRTALDLAGVAPRVPLQAKSLLPILEGDLSHRLWDFAYVEKKSRGSLVSERWKYLFSRRKGVLVKEELYDLVADPGQSRNVAAEEEDLIFALRRVIRTHDQVNEVLAAETEVEEVDVDPATRRQLGSLGYFD